MDSKLQVTVVIPCLNEAVTIERAVRQARLGLDRGGLSGEVVVADNGSTDGSQEIAKAAGARVVPVAQRGWGAALDGGSKAAYGDVVITGDADLSYPFDELAKVVAPVIAGSADLCLGTRLRGPMEKGAMPFLNRYLGTPALSILIRLFFGFQTSDCNSGMRAIKKTRYLELGLACPGMEYGSEMLVSAAAHRFRYQEVVIPFRKDLRGRPPHMKRWRDGWRHLRLIFAAAPAWWTVGVPAGLALGLLVHAFATSFGERPFEGFVSLALAAPLLLIALAFTLTKAALSISSTLPSRLATAVIRLCQDAAPFYVSVVLFFLAAVEAASLGLGVALGGAAVRIAVYLVLASGLFGLELGLGMLNLTLTRTRHA